MSPSGPFISWLEHVSLAYFFISCQNCFVYFILFTVYVKKRPVILYESSLSANLTYEIYILALDCNFYFLFLTNTRL